MSALVIRALLFGAYVMVPGFWKLPHNWSTGKRTLSVGTHPNFLRRRTHLEASAASWLVRRLSSYSDTIQAQGRCQSAFCWKKCTREKGQLFVPTCSSLPHKQVNHAACLARPFTVTYCSHSRSFETTNSCSSASLHDAKSSWSTDPSEEWCRRDVAPFYRIPQNRL